MLNQNLLLAGDDAYNLTKSLRLRSSASAYLSRTPASAGNRNVWTVSFWFKRGKLGSSQAYYTAGTGANVDSITVASSDKITIDLNNTTILLTSQVFRDPSAWYHLVFAVDTSQATASNRAKLYINGSLVTAFDTDNRSSITNNLPVTNTTVLHKYGYYDAGILYSDVYYAEVNGIDGQQLPATSFGSTNALTGVWQPAKYTGTYGTDGYYLPFTNTTSTTTLGYDFSGNSNNWTTNNLSLTTGSTYDSMTDVPTLTSTTVANYSVLNPLSTTSTIIDGNLKYSSGTTFATSTMFPTSGKFYAEVISSGAFSTYGVAWGFSSGNAGFPSTAQPGASAINGTWFVYSGGGLLGTWIDNASGSNYANPFTVGQTWQLAIDATNGYVWLGQNNTWYSSIFAPTGDPATGANPTFTISSISTRNGVGVLCGTNTAGGTFSFNFGQQGFVYTPPTGFVALNTYNLPTSTIVKGNTVMDATTFTGNSSGASVVNTAGFKPDLVWMKDRSAARNNELLNSVTGGSSTLFSNLTNAEATDQRISSFNSNGFTYTSNSNSANTGESIVGWQWQAGQGTTSSNTSGSITSTVSVNASAGFSVVTYSANGSTGTVGHGLGVAPSMIIVKKRNAAERWCVYHTSTSNAYLYLNETFAAETGNANIRFGDNSVVVQPTSSVFTIGSSNDVNGTSGTYVAYCWSEIAGFSKFGSYTGNGSTDGTFVYTGFRPAFIMIKRTDSGGTDWVTMDYQRLGYNVTDVALNPNASYAENSGYATDFTSNGFKLRTTTSFLNGSGATYIYMAFAENPFKHSLAR